MHFLSRMHSHTSRLQRLSAFATFLPAQTVKPGIVCYGTPRLLRRTIRCSAAGSDDSKAAKLMMRDKADSFEDSPLAQALSFEALQLEMMANTETKTHCSGCGVVLQGEEPDSPGYVPESRNAPTARRYIVDAEEGDDVEGELKEIVVEDEDEKGVVCQRCYKLNHYGAIADALRVKPNVTARDGIMAPVSSEYGPVTDRGRSVLSAARFRACIESLRKKSAVIVYLVDIFDFNGSFLTSLQDLVGRKNPMLLAVNKVDLLPQDYKESRVERWVRAECDSLGLHNVASIHMISSIRGTGVSDVLDEALRVARGRRCDIYVIGAANVGKSSFINKVVSMRSGRQRRERVKAKSKKNSSSDGAALTTSVIPGTTLDTIRIPLGHNVHLYDTPGIIVNHQITNRLNSEELKAVLPSKSVERVTLRLGEGKSLFLGGLARIDVLEGKPFFFTVFVSSRVKVHPGRTEGAEEFTLKHSGQLLTPPYNADRLNEMGEWTSKSFTAEGVGWKRASLDIVLSGLGWVSLVGSGSIKLRVNTPYGMGVFTRDALMPFEVQAGVSRYTGGKSINRKKPKAALKAKKKAEKEVYLTIDDWQ